MLQNVLCYTVSLTVAITATVTVTVTVTPTLTLTLSLTLILTLILTLLYCTLRQAKVFTVSSNDKSTTSSTVSFHRSNLENKIGFGSLDFLTSKQWSRRTCLFGIQGSRY